MKMLVCEVHSSRAWPLSAQHCCWVRQGRRKTTDGSGIAVGSVAPAVAQAQAGARKARSLLRILCLLAFSHSACSPPMWQVRLRLRRSCRRIRSPPLCCMFYAVH